MGYKYSINDNVNFNDNGNANDNIDQGTCFDNTDDNINVNDNVNVNDDVNVNNIINVNGNVNDNQGTCFVDVNVNTNDKKGTCLADVNNDNKKNNDSDNDDDVDNFIFLFGLKHPRVKPIQEVVGEPRAKPLSPITHSIWGTKDSVPYTNNISINVNGILLLWLAIDNKIVNNIFPEDFRFIISGPCECGKTF